MTAKLIALAGPSGCGKSTIAKQLERHGYKRVRFAGPIKAMLRTLGLSEEQVDGSEKGQPLDLLGGKSYRDAATTLGTGWGRRMIGEDIWVNATMLIVDKLLAEGHDVVIDDCRYDNEARAVVNRSGIVCELVRDGAGLKLVGWRKLLAGIGVPSRWLVHSSEAGVSQRYITATVYNNGLFLNTAQTIKDIANA